MGSEISTMTDLPASPQVHLKDEESDARDFSVPPLIHPDDANQSNYRNALNHDIHLEQHPMFCSLMCCTRDNTREAEIISRTTRPVMSSHLVRSPPAPESTCLQVYFG